MAVGGAALALVVAVLLVSSRQAKQGDISTLPSLVHGNSYSVRVDPHSNSPVGLLAIILIKQDAVAGNIKVDPVYAELAKETGGSVNVMDPTKFKEKELADHMFAVMSVDLSKGKEALFATGTVKTSGKLSLSVYTPDGNLYSGESKDNAGSAMFTIASPVPGDWKVVVSGDGAYEIHAAIGDDKDFYKVSFVELGGRPGHQGLFPITHELAVGEDATLSVVTLSELTDLRAYFKLSNQRLVELSRIADEGAADEFYFKGAVPPGTFTVLLRWTDIKTQNKMEREFYPTTTPI